MAQMGRISLVYFKPMRAIWLIGSAFFKPIRVSLMVADVVKEKTTPPYEMI